MSAGKRSRFGFIAQIGAVLGVVGAMLLLIPDSDDRIGNPARFVSSNFWQGLASPGELSRGHAFLETDCKSCHAPVAGPVAMNCALCHANNESLLQRQPTAFHADIGSCRECHAEHKGLGATPTIMDHEALTKIGMRQRAGEAPQGEATNKKILRWIREGQTPGARASTPYLSVEESVLDCASCHTLDDRHFGLFGSDCASCHSTAAWSLPDFRHPQPTSVDCSQCHQAPPSHYMNHFNMVSRPVARKLEARVDQCFLCHQTTAWPDIRGVGWYKHH